LYGTIPTAIGNLNTLTTLSMYTNSLTGTIPVSMSKLTLLTTLKLQSNHLTAGSTGSMTAPFFYSATINSALDLSGNCLAYSDSSTGTTYAFTATNCRPTGQPTMRKFARQFVSS
jgi:hypothetical protein